MFKKIRTLFLKDNDGHQEQNMDIVGIQIDEYFKVELEKSPYIKKNSHELVMKHLNHEINLTQTENKLSSEEKKALGLNPRQSITQELIHVLTEEALKLHNPKAVLSDIYYKAIFAKSRDEDFAKLLRMGVKKFTLLLAGDGSECTWCKENSNGQFDANILKVFNSNCSCDPYSKTIIQPIIEIIST